MQGINTKKKKKNPKDTKEKKYMQTISTPQNLKPLRKLKYITSYWRSLVSWKSVLLRDNKLIWCDGSRPSSLADSNSSISLSFFVEEQGKLWCIYFWLNFSWPVCNTLALPSLAPWLPCLQKNRRWSNWPRARTAFSRN